MRDEIEERLHHELLNEARAGREPGHSAIVMHCAEYGDNDGVGRVAEIEHSMRHLLKEGETPTVTLVDIENILLGRT